MAQSPVTYISACVIEDKFAYMATVLDDLDPEDEVLSRMSFFDGRSGEKWFYHDLVDWRVISLCVMPATATTPRMVCALSKQGQVELYSRDTSIVEIIPDAGLISPSASGHGYVNKIRWIGKHLYVCGVGGQIYKRLGPQQWVHMDSGILQSLASRSAALQRLRNGGGVEAFSDVPPVLDLADIAGPSESDLYVVGSGGAVFHYDGQQWRPIDVGIDDDLTAIYCESPQEVWLCGANGYIFVGNAKAGFRNVSSENDNQTLLSITKFLGVLYVSSSLGIYRFNGKQLEAVRTSLAPEIADANLLESTANSLWSFGFKDLVRFDGMVWKRIKHPDNPAI